MAAKSLLHCEIPAKIGEDGMGEVYRTRDTKLGWEVAFKILPAEMATSPERRARCRMLSRSLAGFLLVVALIFAAQPVRGQSLGMTKPPRKQRWGLGMMVRATNTPFATDDKTVATLIPLILFENKRFYFREIEGGVKLFRLGTDVEFSAMGRFHFFDIPKEFQNQIQGDTIDWGFQARFMPDRKVHVDVEALADNDGHFSAFARVLRNRDRGDFQFTPWAFARYKSSHYNTHFWGLNQENLAAGVEVGGGMRIQWNVISSFYLTGAGKVTYLDNPVRNATLVEDDWKWETFIGLGLSDPKDKPRTVRLPENAYLRLGYGWATPSSLADIVHFSAEPDPDGNTLGTVFYGHPLSDRLFGLPIDIYLHSGLGWHFKSEVQNHEVEFVLSIKLYYSIPLPVRIRVGFAEGLSWVTAVPARERQNLEAKGYHPSQLLNYLDPSVDINLGDIFGDSLKGLWLGYYIHHRSALFETAQQFGRIKGGSNFQMVYLQYHW